MQTTRTTTKASASHSTQATQMRDGQDATTSHASTPGAATGVEQHAHVPTMDLGPVRAEPCLDQSARAFEPTVVPYPSAASAGIPAPVTVALPSSTIATDTSLLSLRSFVILTIAFVMALTVGVATMLTAVYVVAETPLYVPALTGFTAFSATFLTAAAGLNGLISR